MKNRPVKIFYFALLFLATSFYSCKKANVCDCFESTGSIESEIRQVPIFTSIYMENNENIYLTQGATQKIEVQAGKNLLPLISTEVNSEGELDIKNYNICNFLRSYKKPINIYITMPRLTYVTNNGVGIIQSTNAFTTDTINVRTESSGDVHLIVNNTYVDGHMHGAGDVYLSGNTQEFSCNNVGNGFIYGSDLTVSNYAWLGLSTTGNAYLTINGLFQVLIHESGNVYYGGNPTEIKQIITGSGNLYKQ
ncbi:MAG: head GIN domain-containing protein [Bacteroidia bacterium]